MSQHMSLQIYRTLWGCNSSYAEAAAQAANAGMDGLEGQVPADDVQRAELAQALADYGLAFIAEITTAGSYVPDRRATVDAHILSFRDALARSITLKPRLITCIGGCDAWPFSASLRFFREAMALAAQADVPICFETHRARSLFTPWVTLDVARALPDIRFTFDFSHWCVVCERLLDSELDTLRELAPRAAHIHARVGYDQGPQVPNPAAPEYAAALAAHQRWWEMLWSAMSARGDSLITMTPEFGPDGYLQAEPFTQKPVADLWEINRWMTATERQHFADWQARLRLAG
jgi:sugar phosphate isomerase/epimerase